MEIPRATPQVPGEVIRKEVKEVRVIEISKKLYRTLESFVASSNKEGYFWNTGVKADNTIMFIKPSKWALKISLKPEIPLDSSRLTCPIRLISLLSSSEVSICFNYSIRYYDIFDIKSFVEIDDVNLHELIEFTMPYEWDFNLRTIALYNKDVPYSYLIYLFDIVDRIDDFVDLAKYYKALEAGIFEKRRELRELEEKKEQVEQATA